MYFIKQVKILESSGVLMEAVREKRQQKKKKHKKKTEREDERERQNKNALQSQLERARKRESMMKASNCSSPCFCKHLWQGVYVHILHCEQM